MVHKNMRTSEKREIAKCHLIHAENLPKSTILLPTPVICCDPPQVKAVSLRVYYFSSSVICIFIKLLSTTRSMLFMYKVNNKRHRIEPGLDLDFTPL